MPENSAPDFSTPSDWLKAQQQYWDAWLTLSHHIFNTPTSTTNAVKDTMATTTWADALELWWRALLPSVAPDTQEIFRKIIGQGKSYFRLNGEFVKAFERLSGVEPNAVEWQTLWDKALEELKQSLSNILKEQKSTLGFWDLPLDNWRRTLSSLSVLPGDFLQNLKNHPEGFAGQDKASLERLLSVPGMGYTQKWQDQIQEALRLWVNYQKVQQEYTSVFSTVGLQAVDLLRDKLALFGEKGQSIDSLRAIYNLWVECSEEAYAQVVNTEEYAEVYGRLINSLMAWKQHERCMVDEMLGALNMPARQDLESMSARMQAMRREIKILQSNQLVVEELRQEINLLKARLKKPSTVRRKSTDKKSPAAPTDKSSTTNS